MRIKKVKYDLATVSITLADAGEKWDREEAVNSREAPHPDFVAALADLVPCVLDLCELPTDYEEGMRVQSVSFSEDTDGNRGAVVTAIKTLADVPAPLVLNTPHVSERPNAEGACTMPRRLSHALDVVEREARAFLDGKRAQADLFGETLRDGLQEMVNTDAGLEYVTLSSRGRSVTLTKETGERARAAAGMA